MEASRMDRVQLTSHCLVVWGLSTVTDPTETARSIVQLSETQVLQIAPSAAEESTWIILLSSPEDQVKCKQALKRCENIKVRHPGINDIPDSTTWIDVRQSCAEADNDSCLPLEEQIHSQRHNEQYAQQSFRRESDASHVYLPRDPPHGDAGLYREHMQGRRHDALYSRFSSQGESDTSHFGLPSDYGEYQTDLRPQTGHFESPYPEMRYTGRVQTAEPSRHFRGDGGSSHVYYHDTRNSSEFGQQRPRETSQYFQSTRDSSEFGQQRPRETVPYFQSARDSSEFGQQRPRETVPYFQSTRDSSEFGQQRPRETVPYFQGTRDSSEFGQQRPREAAPYYQDTRYSELGQQRPRESSPYHQGSRDSSELGQQRPGQTAASNRPFTQADRREEEVPRMRETPSHWHRPADSDRPPSHGPSVQEFTSSSSSRSGMSAAEEERNRRTVLVTVTTLLTDDIYWNHFESERNDGGKIDDLQVIKDEKSILIVFNSALVAERVMSRTHTIGGSLVTLKRGQHARTYPQKLLFRGVPEVKHEHLKLFLENVAGCDVSEILYAEELHTIMVTFKAAIDFHQIQAACQQKRKSLDEGSVLSVSKVPLCKSIIVSKLTSSMPEGYLKLHFESKGWKVENIKPIPSEEGKCIVYFEDAEVINSVMNTSHELDGITLEVKPYYPCLGQMGGWKDPRSFVMPKPIMVTTQNDHKLTFLRHSKTKWEEFHQQLSVKYACPQFEGNRLKIHCTLTTETSRARFLAKNWEEDVQRIVEDQISTIRVARRNVEPLIWRNIKEKLDMERSCKSEKATLIKIPQEAFVIVGMETYVGEVFAEVDRIAKGIEDEHQRKMAEETCTCGLAPYKAQLLKDCSFAENRSSKDLRIKFENERNEIVKVVFQGSDPEIKKATQEMWHQLEKIQTCTIPATNVEQSVLSKVDSLQFFTDEFRQYKKVAAVQVLVNGEVAVHAFTKTDLDAALQIVRSSLTERKVIKADKETSALMTSNEWKSFLQELRRKCGQTFEIVSQRSHICVIATKNIIDTVTEQVKMFLKENTIYTEVIHFSKSRQKFITTVWRWKLRDLKKRLEKMYQTTVFEWDESYMQIEGPQAVVLETKKRLREIDSSITCHEKRLEDEELRKFMHSPHGHNNLDRMASKHDCVWSSEQEPSGIQAELSGEPHSSISPGCKYSFRGVSISPVCSDITTLQVDVIVNAANNEVKHGAGLAKAIVSQGGQSIQDECRDLLKKRGGYLPDGDILVSGSGRLPCKAIIHAVGPVYKGGKQGEKQLLSGVIRKCLDYTNRKGFKSIAIPAISCGVFEYPMQEATQVIVEAVKNFLASQEQSSIQSVVLCAFEEDVFRCFSEAVCAFVPAPSPAGPAFQRFSPPPAWETARSMASSFRTQEARTEPAAASPAVSTPIRIEAVDGKIAEQDVTVIVNSASADLDLKNGQVSSSILEGAGRGLQEECKAMYRNGIRPGEVAITGSHKLRSSAVFHVTLPQWKPGGDMVLQDTVTRCLTEASKRRYQAIAFPVLGAGNLKYPMTEVVQAMVSAVHLFQANHSPTSLKVVKFVVYQDRTTLQQFQRCIEGTPSFVGAVGGIGTGSGSVGPTLNSDFVTIMTGEISAQSTDVIVNSTNKGLSLKDGAVSKSILNAAGPVLQNECRAKYPNGITPDTVAVTQGCNLSCKEVFHVVVKELGIDSEQKLSELVIKCLRTASDKGRRSIAFPVLGAGNMGYPWALSARAMLSAIQQFRKDNPASSVSEVKVVVYHTDRKVLEAFEQQKKVMLADARANQRVLSSLRLNRSFPDHLLKPESSSVGMQCKVLRFGTMNFLLKKGDVLQEDVDAVIVTTTFDLNLQLGEVSRKLVTKCPDITLECLKKEQEFQMKGYIYLRTQFPQLRCKYVVFINTSRIGDVGVGYGKSGPSSWEDFIMTGLKTVDSLGLKSVAFPAFGLGRHKATLSKRKSLSIYSRK
ncbi:protein mono-ADP-ribosyltransferase PARP14-like [Babylonia areolata]|uniref:protein mono-ADP-ribosyltransferase PARP14-like n=1 Tax=Babylonia areolata TaxID=304850 RepID=UPI003FD28200